MLDSDIGKLDLADLKSLHRALDKAIEAKEQEAVATARKAVEDTAREHGFTLLDLYGSKPRASRKADPKYANPANATQTWSGRGRQPQWIKDALASGRQLADLSI